MASNIGVLMPETGVTIVLPVVVLIVVPKHSRTDLKSWLTGVAANAVSQDLRYCFSVSIREYEHIDADFSQMVQPFAWSAIAIDACLEYPAALTEVAKQYPGHDIIQVTAGAHLPFAWDGRLQKGAYAAPRIAAATAMCDVAPMFQLLDEGLRETADLALVDRAAFTMGDRSYYAIARVHHIATYLCRAALDITLPTLAVTSADPETALDILMRRMRAKGYDSVICDFLYVGSPASITPDNAVGDKVEASAYLQNHPLAALRRAVNSALRANVAQVSVPGLDSRPVLLHISHFWGGGLEKWVRDFAHVDDARIHLVFSSYRIGETGGQRLVLCSSPADMTPIRVWDIAQPIRSTVSSSIEYRRILDEVVRQFDVEAIIVSSLIGHSLDALDQPVKTLVVCHDFYPICQAINPYFDTTCERCTLDDLSRCAKSNPLNSIFMDQTSEDWHEMRNLYVTKLIENRIDMVAPSPSVIKTIKRLVPRLEAITTHLIPHGIGLKSAALPAATRTASEPLRIVVLGRLSRHKGTELLREAAIELSAYAEITLVGCGGNGVKLAKACNWNAIEKYLPEELPDILRKLSPHVGLLASVIPETFSYTLSELNQLGIPTIATALGSFNDRIVHGESGFLFNPDKQSLLELIRTLHAQPDLLDTVAARLRTQKVGRSLEDMLADYRSLLPAGSRQVARFHVAVGQQTGLTEPYRQLTEAYAQLNEAYAQMRDAYVNTKTAYAQTEEAYLHANAAYLQAQAAYDQQQAQLAALRTLIDICTSNYAALEAETHVWRIPEAMQLTAEFHEKIRALAGNAPRIEALPPDLTDKKEQ